MSDSINNVDVADVRAMLDDGAVLLDVREQDEWIAGRSADARHIRLSDVPDRFGELPENQTILCVCRSGGRSARAVEFLTQQGYVARNVAGGMQSWAANDLPLTSDGDRPEII